MKRRFCQFCLTDPDTDTLQEIISKLVKCLNCRSDISLKGRWTGHGWQTVLALGKRFSAEEVSAAWNKEIEKITKKTKRVAITKKK